MTQLMTFGMEHHVKEKMECLQDYTEKVKEIRN